MTFDLSCRNSGVQSCSATSLLGQVTLTSHQTWTVFLGF